jgi:hypothetical protein
MQNFNLFEEKPTILRGFGMEQHSQAIKESTRGKAVQESC